jgi:hypothetical protein
MGSAAVFYESGDSCSTLIKKFQIIRESVMAGVLVVVVLVLLIVFLAKRV